MTYEQGTSPHSLRGYVYAAYHAARSIYKQPVSMCFHKEFFAFGIVALVESHWKVVRAPKPVSVIVSNILGCGW